MANRSVRLYGMLQRRRRFCLCVCARAGCTSQIIIGEKRTRTADVLCEYVCLRFKDVVVSFLFRCALNVWTLRKVFRLGEYAFLFKYFSVCLFYFECRFSLSKTEKLFRKIFNGLVECLSLNWFNFARSLEFYRQKCIFLSLLVISLK